MLKICRQGKRRKIARNTQFEDSGISLKSTRSKGSICSHQKRNSSDTDQSVLLRREAFPHSHPLTFNMWQAKPPNLGGLVSLNLQNLGNGAKIVKSLPNWAGTFVQQTLQTISLIFMGIFFIFQLSAYCSVFYQIIRDLTLLVIISLLEWLTS